MQEGQREPSPVAGPARDLSDVLLTGLDGGLGDPGTNLQPWVLGRSCTPRSGLTLKYARWRSLDSPDVEIPDLKSLITLVLVPVCGHSVERPCVYQ